MPTLLLLAAFVVAHAPTSRTVAPQASPSPALKANVGDLAPDFTLLGTDGKDLKLSDFRGKVVILDFWATWCGWCKVAMPDLERLSASVKDQGVVVLSPCVFDDKAAYEAWIKANAGTKYSFAFGYDRAGKDKTKSFAKSKYGIFGLPTTFVIDKAGRIVETVVGYSQDGHEVKAALEKLGVRTRAAPSPASAQR